MSQIVSCKLYGGLGNQMFQIFATIAYSLRHNMDFIFEYSPNLGKRPTYWHTFFASICDHTTTADNIPVCEDVGQDVAKPLFNQNIMLNGYFQSYLFFEDHFKTILKIIDVEKQQTNISNMHKNSISLHFRRGDYKYLPDCHPIMGAEYYANALNYILAFDDSIKYVHYFCEDEDLADVEKDVSLLKTEFRQIVFERRQEKTDWEEMLAMSCCKHNIIANSSFSWWGAYLNPNPHKIVCYPSVWFGPLIPENTDSMFPANWIKI